MSRPPAKWYDAHKLFEKPEEKLDEEREASEFYYWRSVMKWEL